MLLSRNHRIALCLATGCAVLLGQAVQTSQLAGEVKDASGAPLIGAKVLLVSPALQGQRVFVTDASGRFVARLLPPGEYTVLITKDGFQALKINQKLALAQSYSPRFVLQPIGNATIEVVGTLSQLDRTSVESSTNFQMDHVEGLPITRTPESMLILTPGVQDAATGTASTGDGREQIRGAMSQNNKYLIDGQNVNDATYGTRSVEVIDDAVQEIQVLTGAMPAEYGDVDGGVVNTVTKAGGNVFSGSLRLTSQNESWNATQPLQDHGSITNKLIYNEQLCVGGYFLKDKLWFFVAGYDSATPQTQSLAYGPYSGTPFTSDTTDRRLQTKLTWNVSQNNSLTFSYLTHWNESTNSLMAAGDLASLETLLTQDSLWSVNLMSIPTSNLTVEARIGEKRVANTSGGMLPNVTPIYDNTLGVSFGNGMGDFHDGGAHNDNLSADLKGTLQWEALGHHETALGGNYLRGTVRGRNQASPTNQIFNCYGYNPNDANAATNVDGGNATPYLATYLSSSAKAFNDTLGLYLNDKWEFNKNLSFNLGLRWDKYHAYSEDTSISTGANGFSPRLGLKYDFFGDMAWQATFSFCRYNSSPQSMIVNSVSNAGNPTEIEYLYGGPISSNGDVTYANLTNTQNYTQVFNYTSPYTTLLPSRLRVPHTDEFQVSLAHGFKVLDREAFIKLTLVNRGFKDLLVERAGNDGMFTPPDPYAAAGAMYHFAWDNSPEAKRIYRDAELEWGFQGDRLNLGGNVTWSSLEGNYQGLFSLAGNAGLEWFNVVNGKTEYDWHELNPYGKLMGDVPLRIRLAADYHWDWSWGKTTAGLIYRFDSGQHVSMTRNISPSMLSPDLGSIAQVNGSWLQFYNNERGNVVWNSQAYTDLTFQQDFQVIQLFSRGVKFFAKITATNVFNHQQQTSTPNTWEMPQNALSDPWVSANYALSQNNFGPARTYLLEAGFKF